MRVAQRASSVTGIQDGDEGCLVVDRFHVTFGNGGSYNTVLTGAASSEVPNIGLTSSFKLTVTTNDTVETDEFINVAQGIENRTIKGSGWNYRDPNSKLVLSFWARTSVGGTYSVSARNWEAFESQFYYVQTIDLVANEWKHNILTIPGHPKLNFNFDNTPGLSVRWYLSAGPDRNNNTSLGWASGSTIQANEGQVDWSATNGATFNLTGVQLEVGDTATPFELRSWDDEIRDCSFFYQKSYNYSDQPGTATQSGAIYIRNDGSNEVQNQLAPINYKTPIRSAVDPTVYSLDGTINRVSDCNSGTDHALNEQVEHFIGVGINGFSGFDGVNAVGTNVAFHYTVDAEFGSV